MDYKAMAETIYDFLLLVDSVDPYRDNAGKVNRFVRLSPYTSVTTDNILQSASP